MSWYNSGKFKSYCSTKILSAFGIQVVNQQSSLRISKFQIKFFKNLSTLQRKIIQPIQKILATLIDIEKYLLSLLLTHHPPHTHVPQFDKGPFTYLVSIFFGVLDPLPSPLSALGNPPPPCQEMSSFHEPPSPLRC